jgi:hypothetical protein
MRRFGVRSDPEEEAIRFYNRVRRGGRWPENFWERPGRIRAAWAILDYWLRRILGSEDPSAYRQLTDPEIVKQSLEKPVAVMEDLYGPNWRDLASIVDEVRRGVAIDEAWSEAAVVESFNRVYAKTFPDQAEESAHYQGLRRGITRGVRALEAEYAAEEAEREQRFQEKDAVITLVLRDEDDLLPIIDALERDFPVDRPARYVCWTLKDGFRGVLYYCEECGGLHAEESDEHMNLPLEDSDD